MSAEKPSDKTIEQQKAEIILKKRLMLFLSVDIVGSTEFKHKGDDSHSWLIYFLNFYEDFAKYYQKWLGDKEIREDFLGNPSGELFVNSHEEPTLWKTLGDELLFYHELNHYKQPSYYIYCFQRAILDFNKELKIKSEERLKLKGTGWIAGFPVGNMILIEEFVDETRSKLDFIGPLVDVGFRLSKYSSEQKFIVSVDLALLISRNIRREMQFHYDGRENLKGVLGNKPYPVIWLRMFQDELESETQLRTKCETQKIEDFCTEFIKNSQKPMRYPFIDGDEHFFKIENKDDYEESYQKTQKAIYHILQTGTETLSLDEEKN